MKTRKYSNTIILPLIQSVDEDLTVCTWAGDNLCYDCSSVLEVLPSFFTFFRLT